jgi:hypothetical protein
MKSKLACDPQEKDCTSRSGIRECVNSNGPYCKYVNNTWSRYGTCEPEDSPNCTAVNDMGGVFSGGWTSLTDVQKYGVCAEYGKRRGLNCIAEPVDGEVWCKEYVPSPPHHGTGPD